MRASWPKLAPLAIAFATIAVAQDAHPTLAIGSAAPDFSLPGVDGKTHKLADFKSAKLLAVVFTCNHCPTAQLYEGRIKRLVAEFKPKGVAFVAIQPNDPNALRIDEMVMSDMNDSFEEMKIRAKYREFTFPYLYDGETQKVSQAYGPKTTPHIFLFDAQRKLRYEGRIDDNQRIEIVKTHDVRVAIEAMLEGKEVAVSHTPVFGCSTKWKEKEASRLETQRKIEAEPVTVELAGVEALKKLRANPTGKYMVVNFWATWCAPCVKEMPLIQETFRMYRSRPLTVVTVSANAPDEKEQVMAVLKKEHASTQNLLFDSADTYKLQAAFDEKWESGVPYTILIAPDGKVLYREVGEVDILALRRTILRNLNSGYAGFRDYWREKE